MVLVIIIIINIANTHELLHLRVLEFLNFVSLIFERSFFITNVAAVFPILIHLNVLIGVWKRTKLQRKTRSGRSDILAVLLPLDIDPTRT